MWNLVAEVASEVAEDVLRWYEKLITDCFTSPIRLKDFECLARDHIIYADDLAELAQNEAVTLRMTNRSRGVTESFWARF